MDGAGETASVSQCLFAALFHASQPGLVINPVYPAVLADPSPHITLLLATAVSDMLLRQLINCGGCTNGVHIRGEDVHRHKLSFFCCLF